MKKYISRSISIALTLVLSILLSNTPAFSYVGGKAMSVDWGEKGMCWDSPFRGNNMGMGKKYGYNKKKNLYDEIQRRKKERAIRKGKIERYENIKHETIKLDQNTSKMSLNDRKARWLVKLDRLKNHKGTSVTVIKDKGYSTKRKSTIYKVVDKPKTNRGDKPKRPPINRGKKPSRPFVNRGNKPKRPPKNPRFKFFKLFYKNKKKKKKDLPIKDLPVVDRFEKPKVDRSTKPGHCIKRLTQKLIREEHAIRKIEEKKKREKAEIRKIRGHKGLQKRRETEHKKRRKKEVEKILLSNKRDFIKDLPEDIMRRVLLPFLTIQERLKIQTTKKELYKTVGKDIVIINPKKLIDTGSNNTKKTSLLEEHKTLFSGITINKDTIDKTATINLEKVKQLLEKIETDSKETALIFNLPERRKNKFELYLYFISGRFYKFKELSIKENQTKGSILEAKKQLFELITQYLQSELLEGLGTFEREKVKEEKRKALEKLEAKMLEAIHEKMRKELKALSSVMFPKKEITIPEKLVSQHFYEPAEAYIPPPRIKRSCY